MRVAAAAVALTPVLALAAGAGGCTAAQTALVIRVDTDMPREERLVSVRVQVTREVDGAPLLDSEYDLAMQRFALPGTVVLNAASSIDARPMSVVVTGNVRDAMPVVRRFTVRFRPGRVVLLDAYLAARCVPPAQVDCGADATCGPCNCDPVDPGALPLYDGNNPSPNTCRGQSRDAADADAATMCNSVTEACNGVDDDCDGLVDEDLPVSQCGVGACQTSVYPCAGGAPVACRPGTPTREVCNGVDDDCNGVPDDNACEPEQSCLTITASDQTLWACCSRVPTLFECRSQRCHYCAVRGPGDPVACCFEPR